MMGSLRQSARVGSRNGVRKRNPATSLLQAIESHQDGLLSQLLLQATEPLTTEDLDDALIKAAARGDLQACRSLLTAGADPNAQEDPEKVDDRYACSPAFSASQAQYQGWLEESAALGGTALHAAVEGGNNDVVQLLLQRDSDANAADRCGLTPLMLVTLRRGYSECASLLLHQGECEVEAVDTKHGRTALHFAAGSGDVQTMEVLLQAGADIDAKDKDDNTPLMLAASPSHYDDPVWPRRDPVGCLKLLLKRGCFLNLVNKHSETALHWAVENRDAQVVKTLLEQDAMVQPEMVHQACLVHQDCEVLRTMVTIPRQVNPDLFVCVLISVIAQHSSKWRIDNKGEADRSHNVARELIRGIPDLVIVEDLFQKSKKQLEKLFQEQTEESIETILEDVKRYGLLGFALKHGKYGIARMLYQAGCGYSSLACLRKYHSLLSLAKHWVLRPWLPSALSNPQSLQLLCRPAVRNHWGCEVTGKVAGLAEELEQVEMFLSLSDLDDIPAYDRAVQDQEEELLNQSYRGRETSKAAYQQTLSLYVNH